NHDHRMGMATLVLGLTTDKPMTIERAEAVGTSFPGFDALMRGLGAQIS
ncbi:MAG: 3-phosphoshikimate 1-carboxyvinyltransferase, partial [Pseudomonadota bacterium]